MRSKRKKKKVLRWSYKETHLYTWKRRNQESFALTSYSWEKRRPSLALSLSMWSARSMTGIGGCSLIPGGRSRERKSEKWHPTCTETNGRTARWVRLPVGPWGGCDGEESARSSTTHEETEKQAGDILVMSSCQTRGTEVGLARRCIWVEWVSMLLGGSVRQTSLQPVVEVVVEAQQEPTSLYRSDTLSLRTMKREETDWSPAKTHFFEIPFLTIGCLSAPPGALGLD